MRDFRLLTADEIECRVQSQSEKGVSLLLYKTARTDAKILDEKFGMFGWQNKFEVINDNLYCSIGVFNKETKEWIWKSDCGVESNTEKEKGEASDAFKRAGFKWGIGAELYSSPRIKIGASDIVIDNGKCKSFFKVSAIGYDENEKISSLTILAYDSKGKGRDVFSFGKSNSKTKQAEPKPKTDQAEPKAKVTYCDFCGNAITPYTKNTGEVATVETLINESKKRYGKCYCAKCQIAKAKEQKAKEKENA